MISKYQNHLLILLAGISWSTLPIFSKLATDSQIDPFNQVFWRLIIGSVSSLLILLLFFKQKIIFSKKIIKYLLVNGVLFLLGFTTFSASIYLGSPIAKAVALNYSYPLAVIIISYIVFKHLPSKKNLLAVILSIISIMLLMELWTVKNLAQINLGDLFAWLNSFAFAGIIVWGTKIRKDLKLNPFLILTVSWFLSIPLLIILSLVLKYFNILLFNPTLNFNFSSHGWLSLVGLGTISSVLPISLMYLASSKLKPFTTSILLLSEPLVVYLVGILLFNQTLSIWGILGMIGIIISVLLV